MAMTQEELIDLVRNGVAENKIISLKTYYLSDYGEMVLKIVAGEILHRFGRPDLMEVVYTAAKELIMNATKANVKRIVFHERGLDPEDAQDYEEVMNTFKAQLVEQKIRQYKDRFVENGYPVIATFYYDPQVLNIKVKNNFRLYPEEERRIRETFARANKFSDLLDFYTHHGDNTEGEGLGITMVGILLDQSGIDRHCFTLATNPEYNETSARIEIPLQESYKPRRKRLEEEAQRRGISKDELRRLFKPSSRP